MLNRRHFLGSVLALCAAPAIVRAESIMRVRPLVAAHPLLTGEIGVIEGFRYIGVEDIRAATEKLKAAAIAPARLVGGDAWIFAVHPDHGKEWMDALRGPPVRRVTYRV